MKPRRNTTWCAHRHNVTTITAGLAREVCEGCGRVRIYYVEMAVQVFAETPRKRRTEQVTREEPTPPDKCDLCSQPAMFVIPQGLTCDEHAWQAAARLDWESSEPWVPIRIDRSNA